MISLTSDIADLILQSNLTFSTLGLNDSIEHLTTGFKLNHAKDNAANSSIVEALNTKISSLLQVRNNTEDGVSLLSTAEGALENIQTLLERLRSIAMQASNETYGSASLDSLQKEADEIIAQLNQIRDTTEFNGLKLFYSSKIENSSNAGGGSPAPAPATRSRRAVRSSSPTPTPAPTPTSSDIAPTAVSTPTPTAAAPSAAPTPYAAGDVIEGSEDFGGKENRIITIDGVEYTVTNKSASENNISYTKDRSTGVVTFLGSNFSISAQKDVSHNVVINGTNISFWGGDLDDTISDTANSKSIVIYGGAGNDTLTGLGNGCWLNGGSGNDTITANALASGTSNIYGEDGDDVINVYSPYSNNITVSGGAGNDIFNIKAGGVTINGEEGDDTFNIIGSPLGNIIINGGEGVNTVTGNIGNNIVANADRANAYIVDLVKNTAKDIEINGIKYNVVCDADSSLVYSINDAGQIKFQNTAGKVSIIGEANKAHNVELATMWMSFTGGYMNDNILMSYKDCFLIELGGDNTIISKEQGNYIDAGDGNNNITIKTNSNVVICGNGDNNVVITTGDCNMVYAGSGNNTITDKGTYTKICGFGDSDNSQGVLLGVGQTKNITIGGIKYSVENTFNRKTAFLYNYDNVTNEASLSGYYIRIKGEASKAQNVKLYGQDVEYHGSNLDDVIKSWGRGIDIYAEGGNDNIQTNLYGTDVYSVSGNNVIELNSNWSNVYLEGDGDNTVYINGTESQNIYGSTGNDTYYMNNNKATLTDKGGSNIYHVNTDGALVNGSQRNDTFYVSGSSNTIAGAGGDDYFIVTGNNNVLDGGTGNDLYTDSGSGNAVQNMHYDPNSGKLHFTYLGEVKTFEIDGNIYTVTNDNNGVNDLSYSKNPNTGILSLDGSKFTIDAPDVENNIDINGSNNTINGGADNDTITVQHGTGNTVNGGAGNDTLISNTENNSLFGGEGNDSITLNASTNQEVNGGDGKDTININSSNNTNINAGNGDDIIKVNGTGNTINAGEGNNDITLSSGNNTVEAGDGNNNFKVGSDNNTITAGDGKNNIGISGSGNTLTSGNTNGNVNINGNNNNVTVSDGNNNVVINGNSNHYTGGAGVDTIKISGNENYAEGGGADDKFTVVKGHDNMVDGNDGTRNTLVDTGVDTIYYNIMKITSQPFELNIKVDIGSGDDKWISTVLDFDLYDFSVDFTTPDGARSALDMIDELLSSVSSQILKIGSSINRLEYALEEQSIKLENMISTRSTLRDADVAKESANYIRYQILQQASATLLSASRNLRAENVLGLLKGLN